MSIVVILYCLENNDQEKKSQYMFSTDTTFIGLTRQYTPTMKHLFQIFSIHSWLNLRNLCVLTVNYTATDNPFH